MAITFVVEPADRAILTFEDPYTFEEWQAAMQSLFTKGAFFRLLVDRRRAAPPTREFVERVVSFLTTHAAAVNHWRTAVVTNSDAAYGTARMIEMLAEARNVPAEVRAFRSYEEAERWLSMSVEC